MTIKENEKREKTQSSKQKRNTVHIDDEVLRHEQRETECTTYEKTLLGKTKIPKFRWMFDSWGVNHRRLLRREGSKIRHTSGRIRHTSVLRYTHRTSVTLGLHRFCLKSEEGCLDTTRKETLESGCSGSSMGKIFRSSYNKFVNLFKEIDTLLLL